MEEKKYLITCSSTVDLPKEYLEKRNIPYVCFHVSIDNEEYSDDLGKSISYKEFYKRLDNGSIAKTSLVSQGEYINFFTPFLLEGYDILHVELSSGISGSYNSCLQAIKILSQEYKNKILVVDSLGASSGYGLLVDKLKDMQEEGKSLKEVYFWAEENKLNVHHWFYSTNLEHYKRGGRISQTAFLIGNLLNIYPLLNMDSQGHLIVRKKVHGKKRLFANIIEKMVENCKDGLEYSDKVFISNSNINDDALLIKKMIEEKFPKIKCEIMINSVGTTIGAHTGSGTLALFFFGNKRND